MLNNALATSMKVAHWLWQKAGTVIVVVLLIVMFVAGYNLGTGPDTSTAEDDKAQHTERDHSPTKTEVTEWICAMHPQIRKATPGTCPICQMKLTPASSGVAGEGMRRLTISPQAVKLLDIQTTPVQRKFVEANVSMVGKIDYDETRLGYITAYVGGRLDRLFVDYTGVTVKKGDHMVELYSPELLAAQEELLQAIQAVKSLRQSDVGIVRETAQATVEASREKLRLWGLTKEQTDALEQRGKPLDNVVINSPLGGIVIHKNAQEGMYVQTGMRIYTIADLTQLWVKFDAYESDLIWLRYGQHVEFTTEAYPGEVFRGLIAFIDPVLDDVRRTVKVRVNVPNEHGRLKPGMFARGRVKAQVASGGRVVDEALAGKWISPMHPEIIKDKPGLCDKCGMPLVRAEELGYVSPGNQANTKPLVVPTSAVLKTGKRAIVYVSVPNTEEPTFEGREIVLGPRAGDYYIVYSNLREGDQVVTNGSFKLDSELQLRAKPSMMTPDGGGGGGHNHGGHGSNQNPSSAIDSNGPAMAMDLPKVFMNQWHSVERVVARMQHAVQSGDMELIQKRHQQFLIALRDVDTTQLKGHALAIWTERSMRLRNDAVETLHANNAAAVARPFKLLLDDLARTRGQLGLKTEHVHDADIRVPDVLSEAVSAILGDYFAVSAALAKGDAVMADAGIAKLRDVLDKTNASEADGGAVQWWQSTKQRLAQALKVMDDAKDLDEKREAFLALSTEMGKVVLAIGDQLEKPVYEVRCPMAFDNSGATWLQSDRKVENPYFGIKMLRCGDVIGTLVFDPALMSQINDSVPAGPALGMQFNPSGPVVLYETENLGGLTSAYFQLAAAMTTGDLAKAQSQAALVREAVEGVKVKAQDGKTPESWARSSANLVTAIEAIGTSADIEQARQGFALLSEEMAAVLRVGAGATGPVYRVKCPMAFDNRGAIWLQMEKKVTNPYLGDSMLRCGSVVETITPKRSAEPAKEHQHD